MLTVLRNIRSTKMLHPASCMMHDGGRRPSVEDDLLWKMTFSGEATSKQGRGLRFGILTLLTNIRSSKVL